MISNFHLTKSGAVKVLQNAKFGDELSIAAVRRLQVPEDLEEFLRTRGKEPDNLSLQDINELADRDGL